MRGIFLLTCSLFLIGCASVPPPPTVEHVELDRFMGDWYVIAGKFTWLERHAHNPVESYQLRTDGKIATTYTFRDGAFDGEIETMTPVGWVHDEETNAEWRMQFVWPIAAPYLIVYLDEAYDVTAVGVPDRDYLWIMSRRWNVSDEELAPIYERMREIGYDPAEFRRMPQQW